MEPSAPTPTPYDQSAHRVRFEWGPVGAASVPADVAVVVDVLSFTTTLTVALEHGIEVFPYEWRDARAAEHALRHGATLAVGRFEALARTDARHVSLSPASIAAAEGIERLVLPSPNGSSIAFGLLETGGEVVGASLRNASAVGAYVAKRIWSGGSVVVVAAGERWHDDSLRPAVEDLWGAGAVVAALVDLGLDDLSVEARSALAAYTAASADLPAALDACASGRELRERGFGEDVEVASAHDVSEVVPVLRGESFVDVFAAASPGPVGPDDDEGADRPTATVSRMSTGSPERFDDAVVTAVLAHMNDDHLDDSLDVVHAYGQPDASSARMSDLDTEAGVFTAVVDGEDVEVRVPWPGGRISERPQIRTAVVDVHTEALRRLGREPEDRH